MIKIELVYNKGYKWTNAKNISVKGYLFTAENKLLKENEFVDYLTTLKTFDEFKSFLKEANGIFSIVIKNGNGIWAAIDSTRSFPLFYYQDNDFFVITDNPETFHKHNIPFVLDENNIVLFRYSGFTAIGNTLLKNVSQIISGEAICFEKGNLQKTYYVEFLTNSFSKKTRSEQKHELKQILLRVGERMIQNLRNKPVAIPLSGGIDSRLMAYLLRKNNYKEVICYTFGKKENIEIKHAKRTAEKLGYKFYFINYDEKDDKLNQDPVFCEYADFAGNYSCKFAEQDYFAVKELIEKKILLPETVFIPGNSGAIAGHLLNKKMEHDNFPFLEHTLEEVFYFVYPRNKEKKIIRHEINILDNVNREFPTYLVYENWRFKGTTAMAFNSSKVWDFFDFQFLLPLWDKELFDFFLHTPFEHKCDKNLYKETLLELFDEFDINYRGEELYPSESLIKKVSFKSKLKKTFPFLKNFVNIEKSDILNAKLYTLGFVDDLKKSGYYRKVLAFNGIFSSWYILRIKQKIQNYDKRNH